MSGWPTEAARAALSTAQKADRITSSHGDALLPSSLSSWAHFRGFQQPVFVALSEKYGNIPGICILYLCKIQSMPLRGRMSVICMTYLFRSEKVQNKKSLNISTRCLLLKMLTRDHEKFT